MKFQHLTQWLIPSLAYTVRQIFRKRQALLHYRGVARTSHFSWLPLLCLCSLLGGCATRPPQNPDNICAVFQQEPDWYDAAKDARERWQMPIGVAMSMMFQESGFRHDAQPPMRYFLGVIPYGRASSAYGYAQAKDETWDDYATAVGRPFASRSNFADAIDFMGWYNSRSARLNKVSKNDAYRLYLNYHESWGGYRQGSYRKKEWLVQTARKVDSRARRYQQQLARCEKDLGSSFWDWF